jgi:hypothetical protein
MWKMKFHTHTKQHVKSYHLFHTVYFCLQCNLCCRWKYIVWNKWYINATGCLNTILCIIKFCVFYSLTKYIKVVYESLFFFWSGFLCFIESFWFNQAQQATSSNYGATASHFLWFYGPESSMAYLLWSPDLSSISTACRCSFKVAGITNHTDLI